MNIFLIVIVSNIMPIHYRDSTGDLSPVVIMTGDIEFKEMAAFDDDYDKQYPLARAVYINDANFDHSSMFRLKYFLRKTVNVQDFECLDCKFEEYKPTYSVNYSNYYSNYYSNWMKKEEKEENKSYDKITELVEVVLEHADNNNFNILNVDIDVNLLDKHIKQPKNNLLIYNHNKIIRQYINKPEHLPMITHFWRHFKINRFDRQVPQV